MVRSSARTTESFERPTRSDLERIKEFLMKRSYFLTACLTIVALAAIYFGVFYAQPRVQSAPTAPKRGVPANPPVDAGWAKVLKSAEDHRRTPFRGITANGQIERGLYPVRSTGVSTRPMQVAAQRFLNSLNTRQRERTQYPMDSVRWRQWSNTHRFPRDGVSFGEFSAEQRRLAFGVLQASLSARGLKQSQDIIALNGHLGQLLGKPQEFGSNFYWLSLFSNPSSTEPWGWQLDGHHLNINYFVLGDQVVITPLFMGSEPVRGRYGPLKDIQLFEREESLAYQLMRSLSPAQKKRAILASEIPENVFTSGFRDNYEMRYAGLPFSAMNARQQQKLLELVETYTSRQEKGHAQLWLQEVKRRKQRLFFAWMGGTGPKDMFYYRVHSPVILIEFDHQAGLFLDKGREGRDHVHSVVRTPNGNDYGRDLLRQHYTEHDHGAGKSHRH
jgi:hypothetical protein